ncbi:cyclic nucleotide-binding domain-containing protein 2-like [Antedon mediterranea]|uniref:cyclic nucleotide-binding domain-containing protein 2-like n=1 Tax=Antedon mediterranea TaxID=105859 RepID=UPI003AF9FF0E
MHFVTYEHRRMILKEGHRASGFYIMLSGTCLVNEREMDYRNGTTFVRTVAKVSNGDAFGGHELLRDTPRKFTYVCKDHVELLMIEKKDFQRLIRDPLEQDREELIKFCKSQELFWGLPVDELKSNYSNLTCDYYKPETVILRNVNEAAHIAIVKSGKCKVVSEISEPIKRPHSKVDYCSRRKEDWKTTAVLRKSMSFFETKKRINTAQVPVDRIFNKRTSIFDDVEKKLQQPKRFEHFRHDDFQKIFIQSPQQLQLKNEDNITEPINCDGIQRTWKRVGFTASGLTEKEVGEKKIIC